MNMRRVWAMPSKHTFLIKPIAELICVYAGTGDGWIDPFAGYYSPAEITNDLNPDCPTIYHLQASDFLSQLNGNSYRGAFLDPPYSPRQIKELYESIGLKTYLEMAHKTAGWKTEKDLLVSLIEDNGYVICCGWNSMGMGKKRGFELIEVLLVCHGAGHSDTIVTVERKLPRLI